MSGVEVVKKRELFQNVFRVGRHYNTYGKWFHQVIALQLDEALKVTRKKGDHAVPTAGCVRAAVKLWNTKNPNNEIEFKETAQHKEGELVIYYLFRKEEEPKRQKSKKA